MFVGVFVVNEETREVFALQVRNVPKRELLNLINSYLFLIRHMEDNCNQHLLGVQEAKPPA